MSRLNSAGRGRAFLLAVLFALLIGGCSSNDTAKVCPRAAVLSEAGSLTRFGPGAGRDILDIEWQGEVSDIVADCVFRDLKGSRQAVVRLTPVFALSRGAANTDGKADFTYFVSVVRNREILSKQLFELTETFPGNRSRMVVRDDDPPIIVDIPLPARATGSEYEILVGFQLTPEELQRNEEARRLGRQPLLAE